MDILIYDNFGAHDKRHIYSTLPIATAEIVEPFYIILPCAMCPESTANGVTIFPKGVDRPILLADCLSTANNGMPILQWTDRNGQRFQYYPGTYGI